MAVAVTLVVVARWPRYLDVTVLAVADSALTAAPIDVEFTALASDTTVVHEGARALLFLPEVSRPFHVVVAGRPNPVETPTTSGLRAAFDSLPSGIASAQRPIRRRATLKMVDGETLTPGFEGRALLRLDGR